MLELARYIDRKLERWAARKFKRLSRRQRRGLHWLQRIKSECPGLFYHWRVVGAAAG